MGSSSKNQLSNQIDISQEVLAAIETDPSHRSELLKLINSFQENYQSQMGDTGFEEAFTEFALTQVTSYGKFEPLKASEEWNTFTLQQGQLMEELQKKIEELVAAKVDPEDKQDIFDVLSRLIDLMIEMTNTMLSLSASYAVLSRNETKKQEVYLEVLNSLKPVSPTSLGYLEKPDSDEAADVFATRNQVIIPGAQSQVSNYNEMSQNEAQSLNTMVTALSDDAKTISDILSDLFSKMSAWSSSIMR